MAKGNFGDLLVGLLIGGAVGYVYAMLNAERTGAETRQMLYDRSRQIRDQAMDTFQNTKDSANKMIDQGREQINDTLNRAKEKAMDLQDQGTDYVTEKRATISDTLHKVADSVDPNTSGEDMTNPGQNVTPSV